ncbi:hypothetical protein CGZ80_02030 [Rhodopirellula sp. MGV]|nr:hypothetical protein CGZ80_02030 [Rhodopirellula sp. MGV]
MIAFVIGDDDGVIPFAFAEWALLGKTLTTASIDFEFFHHGACSSKPEAGISREFDRVCLPHQNRVQAPNPLLAFAPSENVRTLNMQSLPTPPMVQLSDIQGKDALSEGVIPKFRYYASLSYR